MVKRKSTEKNLQSFKKKKIIDICYSVFDSDPDCEDNPEWLPENCDLISESEESSNHP